MRPHRSLYFDAAAAAAVLHGLHKRTNKTTKAQRGSYKKWSTDDLSLALAAIRSPKNSPHHLSFEAAERKYHIPHSTIHDYMTQIANKIAAAPRGSRPNDIAHDVINTTQSGPHIHYCIVTVNKNYWHGCSRWRRCVSLLIWTNCDTKQCAYISQPTTSQSPRKIH